MPVRVLSQLVTVAAVSLLLAAPVDSQTVLLDPGPTYADLADLAVSAPVAAHVRIRRAQILKPEEARNVPSGRVRYYVVADVVALIRAGEGLPTQVSYLADVPTIGGKAPKLAKKSEYIVLARPVPGKPGELQLVSPKAQLPFTAERANLIRLIVREATAKDAPPHITGVGRAFHVPGTLPGESETQFFLQTADGRPVSVSVLRRPGVPAQWAVSLSEITDEAAAPPARNTLLWYRLACSLPAAIPSRSYQDSPEHAESIRADYALVLQGLGRCTRSGA